MVKIGCCSSGVNRFLSVFDSVKFLFNLDFDFIELNTDFNFNEKDVIYLEKFLKDNSINLNLHINLNSIFEKKIKIYKLLDKILEFSNSANVNFITFDPIYVYRNKFFDTFGKFFPDKVKSDFRIKKFLYTETLDIINYTISAFNGKVGLENFYYETTDIKYLDKIITGVKKKDEFGLLLDIGHLNLIFSQEQIIEYLKKFPYKVLEVHLNDNNGYKDEHLSLGKGNIDFRRIFIELNKNKNFIGNFTIEIKSESFNKTVEEIKKSYLFLKNTIPK